MSIKEEIETINKQSIQIREFGNDIDDAFKELDKLL